MEYRRLGRTDLQVSVAGLGTGGYSHFGQRVGRSKDDARRLVRQALNQGVNFFDTARRYMEAEEWLKYALEGVPRDQYILSTKLHNFPTGGEMASADDMRASIDESLQRLGVDTIDLLMFHSLKAEQYDRTWTFTCRWCARHRRRARFVLSGRPNRVRSTARTWRYSGR